MISYNVLIMFSVEKFQLRHVLTTEFISVFEGDIVLDTNNCYVQD